MTTDRFQYVHTWRFRLARWAKWFFVPWPKISITRRRLSLVGRWADRYVDRCHDRVFGECSGK